jgi:hypothetical protein
LIRRTEGTTDPSRAARVPRLTERFAGRPAHSRVARLLDRARGTPTVGHCKLGATFRVVSAERSGKSDSPGSTAALVNEPDTHGAAHLAQKLPAT